MGDILHQTETNMYRNNFPQLKIDLNGHQLVYFDNAATTLKPQSVIDAQTDYYRLSVGSSARGSHTLAHYNELMITQTRALILDFLGAQNSYVVFTRNATESLNIAVNSYVRPFLNRHGERKIVLTTALEHHSVYLPLQKLAKELNLSLLVIPVNENGLINEEYIAETIKKNASNIGCVGITQCSNVTGQILELKNISEICAKNDIPLLVDGTQAIPHIEKPCINLNNAFYVFSAHKLYGPEGVGVLITPKNMDKYCIPQTLGGGMVSGFSNEEPVFKELPQRLEYGTYNTVGILGLKSSIEYLQEMGIQNLLETEKVCFTLLEKIMGGVKSVKRVANPPLCAPIFTLTTLAHPHDIADYLDQKGIAVRAGKHCAEPFHMQMNIPASLRVSLSFYNIPAEIEYFALVLEEAIKKFSL